MQCYLSTDNCVGPSRRTSRAECCDNRGKKRADFGFSTQIGSESLTRAKIHDSLVDMYWRQYHNTSIFLHDSE